MGFFSKSKIPGLSGEEIKARLDELEKCFAAKDYETCIAKAQQLDREAPGYGSFHLGLCHELGYGTAADAAKALAYYEAAVEVEDEFTGPAYYRCGVLAMTTFFDANKAMDCHTTMLKNFQKAEEHGTAVAALYVAYSYNLLALDCRELATKTLRMSEISQANAVAVAHANASIAKYIQVVQQRPQDMDLFQWMRFGLNTVMLYKMACAGELAQGVQVEDSLKTLFKSSFRIVGSQMSGDKAQAMQAQNAALFDFIEQNGQRTVAEFFRADCALVDAGDHHSAEAFYRARWHMKMFGELRSKVTSTQDAETFANFTAIELEPLYEKMQKKYGGYVIDFARQGKLPDLTPSYLPEKAPAVESCQSFMDMVAELRGGAGGEAPAAEPQGKRKSTLAGFMLGGIRGYNKAKKENQKNGFDK